MSTVLLTLCAMKYKLTTALKVITNPSANIMNNFTADETSRDPLNLERLAEELAERELGATAEQHDLPVYVPLSHDNSYLSAEPFNVEEFLLSRAYTSLPDLRTELRDYLATLKEELVQLINDDYEAFISLSTDLRGEGARLERLKWPLGDLRADILVSKPLRFIGNGKSCMQF